jgi:hypothetical protein
VTGNSFWTLNLVTVINISIVILDIVRGKNYDTLLQLLVLLVCLLGILATAMVIRKTLNSVSDRLDLQSLQRLGLNALMLGLMANAAVSCSLSYLR